MTTKRILGTIFSLVLPKKRRGGDALTGGQEHPQNVGRILGVGWVFIIINPRGGSVEINFWAELLLQWESPHSNPPPKGGQWGLFTAKNIWNASYPCAGEEANTACSFPSRIPTNTFKPSEISADLPLLRHTNINNSRWFAPLPFSFLQPETQSSVHLHTKQPAEFLQFIRPTKKKKRREKHTERKGRDSQKKSYRFFAMHVFIWQRGGEKIEHYWQPSLLGKKRREGDANCALS